MGKLEPAAPFFEQVYRSGVPPWDIGHPQKEIASLEEAGEIKHSVLDVGCGTGENALYLAARGYEVWGIDAAPTAIRKARAKAKKRGLNATFRLADALDLGRLNKTFDTIIDSGLFHTLSDEERERFVQNLAVVLRPGGAYFMLVFSEHQPGSFGPRRVTQAEIRAAFGEGWRVNYIREAQMEANIEPAGVRAWLSSITRL